MNSIVILRVVLIAASVLVLYPGRISGANILAILPTRDLDNLAIGEAVVKGLLARGHEVTAMSYQPFERVDRDAYKYVSLNECLQQNNDIQKRYFAEEAVERSLALENSTCACIATGSEYGIAEDVDLMLVGMEYHSCFLRLAVPLNVPVVWIVSSNQNVLANRLTGDLDPLHPIMDVINGKLYAALLQFHSRVMSAYRYLTKYAYHWQIQRYVDTMNRKMFGDDEDGVERDNVDLVLYNTHSTVFPRAHVPNVIEVAGVHIEEPKLMCPRVGQFIDDSENGVIFISTPTQQPYRQMFEKKTQTFEISFLRVSQSVLWRCSATLTIPNYNLFRSEHLPQREILNHKNVIVFVGCATLNNIYEAVSSATPFLGIVCAPEQHDYMARLEQLGVGVTLTYANLNEVTVVNAINLIRQDKSYGEKMQKLSAAFNDRTMTPLNTAVYWAEYAIKHGASHLKSESSKIPLYTYLLLDIGPVSMVLLAVYMYYGILLYIKAYYWLRRKFSPYWSNIKGKIFSAFL